MIIKYIKIMINIYKNYYKNKKETYTTSTVDKYVYTGIGHGQTIKNKPNNYQFIAVELGKKSNI